MPLAQTSRTSGIHFVGGLMPAAFAIGSEHGTGQGGKVEPQRDFQRIDREQCLSHRPQTQQFRFCSRNDNAGCPDRVDCARFIRELVVQG
jgi:hypothetical protein